MPLQAPDVTFNAGERARRYRRHQDLDFESGDLVMSHGQKATHRVTPTEGDATLLLVVFAFNDQPGVALSDSPLKTFYGQTS